MRTFKLQVFLNKCAQCGSAFETVDLPNDHQPLIYDNGSVRQYLDPYEDPVYKETKALMERETGRRMDTPEEAAVFHRLLVKTLDPPDVGEPFDSVWERPPCPECGSRGHRTVRPVDPPRFQTVKIPAVTHARWNALRPDEKLTIVRDVVT